jgi:hypothetical protein
LPAQPATPFDLRLLVVRRGLIAPIGRVWQIVWRNAPGMLAGTGPSCARRRQETNGLRHVPADRGPGGYGDPPAEGDR